MLHVSLLGPFIAMIKSKDRLPLGSVCPSAICFRLVVQIGKNCSRSPIHGMGLVLKYITFSLGYYYTVVVAVRSVRSSATDETGKISPSLSVTTRP